MSTLIHSNIVEDRTTGNEAFKSSSKQPLKPLQKGLGCSTRTLKYTEALSKIPKSRKKIANIKNQASRRSSRTTQITVAQADRLMAANQPVAIPNPSSQATQKDDPLKVGDFSEGNAFFPSVIFGEHEDVGLSKIGRADKDIMMWEQVLIEHKREQPSLVSVVERKLHDAKKRRLAIDETMEENHRVGDIDPASTAIKARLEALQWALDTSKFEPEAANIRCVMEGYMTGAINYSTEFTLVWAAKIVGKAAHYNDFTADRNAILDRYLETYGPGWFFYEAPLKINPDGKPRLGGSVGLQRGNGNFALQLYNINQGFWKQSGFVSRLSRETLGPTQMRDGGPQFIRDEQGRLDCGSPGPKLTFRSLLDSGATYPTLHAEDLIALGIDIFWYPAQSVQTMTTANGSINSRLYELFVCVLDEQGRQLVDPKDAVWPYSHKYLGGLCPVAASTIPMQYDENGLERPFRLSGILPFLACYISSTPGRNTLFLGEDRNDVLGTHRMPGQKKWVIQMPPLQLASSIPFEAYGNPHITFSHRGGQIVDIDRRDKKHASTLIFMPGTAEEEVIENDPGSAQHAARAKMGAGIEAHGLEEEDVTVNPAPINRLYPNDFII